MARLTITTAAVLSVLGTLAAASTAFAQTYSLGAEYETMEGVVGYTDETVENDDKTTSAVKTARRPELTTNERVICTSEESYVGGWPLVSFTHDMGWKNQARTLEIVLGPTKSGDPDGHAAKQSAVIQAFYRALHTARMTACDETVAADYCYVSVAAMKTALNPASGAAVVKDTGCGGDYPAREPAKYDANKAGFLVHKTRFSKVDMNIWTQITIGITGTATAGLIDTDAKKLFGKSGSPSMAGQLALFTAIQTAIATNLGSKSKAVQSLLLYAVYGAMTFVRNGDVIDEAKRGGDGYHAPIWKNAFVLYPKTSVKKIARGLFIGNRDAGLTADATLTADFVYENIARVAAPTMNADEFKGLWTKLVSKSQVDNLDQAKPGSNLTTLLLEVRAPSTRSITITNPGNKDTMTVVVPALAY